MHEFSVAPDVLDAASVSLHGIARSLTRQDGAVSESMIAAGRNAGQTALIAELRAATHHTEEAISAAAYQVGAMCQALSATARSYRSADTTTGRRFTP